MYTLGISEIDNDAGAVLLKDSEVVCGINEERLSRIKRHRGFPYRSIDWILEYSRLSLNEIDYIAIAKASPEVDPERFYRVRDLLRSYDYFSKEDPSGNWAKVLNYLINKYRNAPKGIALAKDMSNQIDRWAKSNGCAEKIIHVPHHFSHAACAYWASGYDKALAVTMDGQGEGVTSTVHMVNNGKFTLLKEILVPSSLGAFYSAVTKALGFKPARHEGKITGLAAYTTPNAKLLSKIQKMAFYNSDGEFMAPSLYGNYPKIVQLAKQYGREQISAAFQYVLEDVAVQYISHYIKNHEIENIVLAGGVFANVKLNERIHDIDGVENIFVFPHMADGGLGYGAAQEVYREKSGDRTPNPINNVYWGPEYNNQEIKKQLDLHGLKYDYCEDIAEKVVECLSNNKVVARFAGRMEFGPRALGNRSILYPANDPNVNDWLNQQLNRSEFMPFAPVTIAEHAKECYLNLQGAEFTSQFMTITFDCTDLMKRQSPAVVHVDGTARPQLISEVTNPQYYKILKGYYKNKGVPSIVNTSFNMHEEPIVCTPDEAIRAFIQGNLDCLAIGDYLVKSTQTLGRAPHL